MTEVEQPPQEAETNLEDVAKAYMEVRQRKEGPLAPPLDAKIAAMLPKVRHSHVFLSTLQVYSVCRESLPISLVTFRCQKSQCLSGYCDV